GMDHVDSSQRLDLGQVQRKGFEGALKFLLRSIGNLLPRLLAPHLQVSLVGMLAAPAMDLHRNLARQLAAQVLHMNSGAAVDVRRVFPCEESYSQFQASWESREKGSPYSS